MNHEQLAFFNQQLAAMLKSGLPLEASLKQLAASMKRGEWRTEIETLEADLEQGVPIEEALSRRKLPEIYVAMLRAGVRSGDLPGVLTMAADYYTHLHTTWLRLKGLLVYPGLVLITSLIVSTLLAVIYTRMVNEAVSGAGAFMFTGKSAPSAGMLMVQVWFPVGLIAITACAFFITLSWKPVQRWARWRLPGFREASLAQLASTIAVMLENGTDFATALDVAQRNESYPMARGELAQWRARLGAGTAKFADIVTPGRLLPPFFVWLVTGAGENWAKGFRRAADAYSARARYRIDLVLYAALPITILFIAVMIAGEMAPVVRSLAAFMNSLGNPDF